MKRKFYFAGTNSFVGITEWNNWENRSHALKLHIKRKLGINSLHYLKNNGYEIPTCAFCGRDNQLFGVITTVVDDVIQIDDVTFKYGVNQAGYKHYCFTPDEPKCPGKLLNPNSAEFIMGVYQIDKEEALSIIHKRNKSPFYAESHASLIDYKKSQSRGEDWRLRVGITKEEQGLLCTNGHSSDAYKERYGDKWLAVKEQHNASKVNSLETFINRYGDADGAIKFKEYTTTVSQSLPNFIRRHGEVAGKLKFFELMVKKSNFQSDVTTYDEFVDYAFEFIKHDVLYKLNSYPLEDKLAKRRGIIIGLELFNKTFMDLKTSLQISHPETMSIDWVTFPTRTKYGYVFYNDDGILFRSAHEFKFYTDLLAAGFESSDIEINKRYGRGQRSFDFYIISLNKYIEIAGLTGMDWYDDKMENKRLEFDCLIVPVSEMTSTIDKLTKLKNTI
jgi:hypothetical protein